MAEWNGTHVLTIPRLELRTFRRDDLPAYAALNRDPEVMRRLGMTFDHEAMLEEDGDRFPAVIHSITAGTWSERAS